MVKVIINPPMLRSGHSQRGEVGVLLVELLELLRGLGLEGRLAGETLVDDGAH